jgi:type I restriction enzyme, S subunit
MEVKAGYKRTEIGVIPEDWNVKKFSNFCILQRGFDLTESTRTNGTIPVYSSSGIAYFHNQFKVKPPGVVTGRKGMLGKIFYIDENFWPHDTTLWVKDFKGNYPKFVYWFLTSFHLERFDAATSIPTLNRNNLNEIDIPVPPLPEQRAIATALSDVDALIDSLDKLIAKKRDIKQAAMQELLTGKRRLPGFSGKWVVKRLGELSEMFGGGTPPTSVLEYYDGKIPWVSIADMTRQGKYISETDRNLTEKGLENCAAKMLPSGTVLFAEYASIGECSIAATELCTSQAILGIQPKAALNNIYLYFSLASKKEEIRQMGQHGTQANLNSIMVKDFKILLPPLSEQTAIIAVLSDMDTDLAALEQKRDKTKALKQGMMQELLTGRIRLT